MPLSPLPSTSSTHTTATDRSASTRPSPHRYLAAGVTFGRTGPIRRAVNARGHFPTEAAALKCVYLAIMSLDPTGRGQRRWSNRRKAALNAFEITFDGRLSATRNAS